MAKPNKQDIWKHNGLLGCIAMAQTAANKILASSTATDTSRSQATELALICGALNTSLRTRRDQE